MITKNFLSVLIIAILFSSCAYETVEQDLMKESKPETVAVDATLAPVGFDATLFTDVATIDFPEIREEISNNLQVTTRDGNCDNFDNAEQQYQWSMNECSNEFTDEYCFYLTTYWRALMWIYLFDCDEQLFCVEGYGYQDEISTNLMLMTQAGYHPIYLNSIQVLFDRGSAMIIEICE